MLAGLRHPDEGKRHSIGRPDSIGTRERPNPVVGRTTITVCAIPDADSDGLKRGRNLGPMQISDAVTGGLAWQILNIEGTGFPNSQRMARVLRKVTIR